MNDFKNEYKAAMNDITPDEALLDKIKEDIKNKLDEPTSEKSIFLSFKPAFSAASLLIAVGIVTVASILVMSPVNKGDVSDGGSDYYSNGAESNDSGNYILADNVIRSVVTYSEEPFSMCVPLSRLSYIADNLEACKFDHFKQYASVIKENGAFSITFFCDGENTESIKTLNRENYADSGSMDYMVRVYFYIDDDDSEPFSIQVSRNLDKDKGAFDGKNGIDLVTSAGKLQDFLDGNYDEPFNNMTVQ